MRFGLIGIRTLRATAFAAGALGGLSGAAYGLLTQQSRRARQIIGIPVEAPLRADGVYLPNGVGPLAPGDGSAAHAAPLRFAVLGDSSAAGLGVDRPEHLPGVLLARGLAEESGRPVHLTTYAVSGVTTRALPVQVDLALVEPPDVAIVIIGANDVRDRLGVRRSAAILGSQLRRLCAAEAGVVVGTCPDFGMIRPIPQPLRSVARAWSRQLAKAQRVEAELAGAMPVSFGDLLSPEFVARPMDLFSGDGFHPNAAGYEAAAALLLAPLCAAAGVLGPGKPAAYASTARDAAHALSRQPGGPPVAPRRLTEGLTSWLESSLPDSDPGAASATASG